MQIRRATPSDVEAIVSLGLEALRTDPYPNLVISEDKVRAFTRLCISAPSDFVWVAEKDGEVVASVAAVVTDMTFYERKQASVVQFYSRAPGAGMPLLRELMRWVRGRRAIKMVVFTLEHRADPRIGKLLTRLGLGTELPIYLKVM